MNKPADLKLAAVPAWINGRPVVPQGRMGDVYNPATGRVTKQVPYCDAATLRSSPIMLYLYPQWISICMRYT